MTVFYQRYEQLCNERGLKPQSAEVTRGIGVSSPAVIKWEGGAIPNGKVLCSIASFFEVTVDYILGLTEVRRAKWELDDAEAAIINTYRSCSGENKLRIAQYCMNLKDEKGMQKNVG